MVLSFLIKNTDYASEGIITQSNILYPNSECPVCLEKYEAVGNHKK